LAPSKVEVSGGRIARHGHILRLRHAVHDTSLGNERQDLAIAAWTLENARKVVSLREPQDRELKPMRIPAMRSIWGEPCKRPDWLLEGVEFELSGDFRHPFRYGDFSQELEWVSHTLTFETW
jgi:hypothetical protein